MKFSTITARFAGTCKRCRQPITVGERIRYGGKGQTYHMASQCPKGTGYTDDPPYAHLGNYNDPQPEPEPVKMTADLAASIRQEFSDLLARPVSLLDYEPRETADDYQETPQPEQFTFTTIAGATVKTVPQPARPASIDADLF